MWLAHPEFQFPFKVTTAAVEIGNNHKGLLDIKRASIWVEDESLVIDINDEKWEAEGGWILM